MASMTWRGRWDVLAESRYATPVSRKGKSFRSAPTSRTLDLDVDIVALQGDRVRARGHHARQAGDRAGLEVEPRPVRRALDVEAPDLAVAEGVLLVRADVGDGVVVAVLGVREADLLPVHDDLLHRVDREV